MPLTSKDLISCWQMFLVAARFKFDAVWWIVSQVVVLRALLSRVLKTVIFVKYSYSQGF
jgi:hypothetical protein